MNRQDTQHPRIPESSFGSKDLEHLWVELSRPNPQAWQRITDEAQEIRKRDGLGNPILHALQQWLRSKQGPEGLQEQRRRLLPAHGFWLERAATVPLGFSRLVLEAARWESLGDGRHGLRYASRARELLRSEALAVIAPDKIRPLRGLADAYLADELRVLGRYRRAQLQLDKAYGRLGTGADEEMLARVLQIESDLLRDTGAGQLARRRLDRAAERLSAGLIPGRWSELQLARGRLHLFEQRGDLARPMLRDALQHLPEDLALPIRFEILHCLAAAEVSQLDFEAAERILGEAGKFQSYGHEGLFGQRQWLLGTIAMQTGRPKEAEKPFKRAFNMLLDLGQRADAAQILVDLIEAYLISGELHKNAEELWNLYWRLAGTHELALLILKRLQDLRDRFAGQGVEVPELESYLARLEQHPEPLVN